MYHTTIAKYCFMIECNTSAKNISKENDWLVITFTLFFRVGGRSTSSKENVDQIKTSRQYIQ